MSQKKLHAAQNNMVSSLERNVQEARLKERGIFKDSLIAAYRLGWNAARNRFRDEEIDDDDDDDDE